MSAATALRDKQTVWALWQAMDRADPASLRSLLTERMAADAQWHGPSPLGSLTGVDAFVDRVWLPLTASFAELKRNTFIFMAGASSGCADGQGDGRVWVGATGTLDGVFREAYLGIPPTRKPASLRFGEFVRLEGDRIVESYVIYDLVDLMEQAGVHVLPPPRGEPGVYPPPAAGDGVLLDAQDEDETAYSLAHIRRFIFGALNAFDESDLTSMGMADYFPDDIAWYGPGGIGACYGLEGFQTKHQQPWLHAFPDRRVQDLTALIADGVYTGGPGWAGVKAMHRGEYQGVAATDRSLAINGLDFWKRDGEQFVENWVFVDMVHLFGQMGVDLMARMAQIVASR
ncbi:MAG: ester cyclase [Pseudomonadota bacterium]